MSSITTKIYVLVSRYKYEDMAMSLDLHFRKCLLVYYFMEECLLISMSYPDRERDGPMLQPSELGWPRWDNTCLKN
jgi:hypothetical protein